MAAHHLFRGHSFSALRLRHAIHLCVAHQHVYLDERVGYIKPVAYCRAVVGVARVAE